MSGAALSALGNAALDYAASGVPVFQLAPGTKIPLSGSSGFKDATTDPDQIRALWLKTSDANIGSPTGKASGRTVLDEDIKPWEGKRGDETLARLVAEFGALPTTLTQRTWSGGFQYVFAYVPGIKNSASALGRDLDIRGEGGYIVLPPSVVTEEGRSGTYAWVDTEAPIAAMPAWMITRLTTESKSGSTSSANEPGWADPFVGGVSQGTRDDRCWRMIGRYALLGLTEVEVLAFMLAWAEKCVPKFPEATVREKVARTFRDLADPRLLSLARSDAGNAERMGVLFGDRFRWLPYNKTGGEWFVWDGRRWAPQSKEAVKRLALDTARALGLAAIRLPSDDPLRMKLLAHALKSESAKGIDDAAKCAKLLDGVRITRKQLDADPELLNVANGTLDLRTFELRPQNPADLITKLIDIPYDPAATCSLWLGWLDEVFQGDTTVIAYIARVVGYCLTGLITEQVFWLLCGAGANGKSTFVAIISALLDEYAKKIDQEAVLSAEQNKGRKASPELMEFVGARLAYVDEMEDDRRMDEARIKSLTGGEKETGRQLYEGMTTWQNTAKLVFDLNVLPNFRGVDEGIARRPKVIPFTRKFKESEQDKEMVKKLKAELPGILAWAVAGCRAWRTEGLNHPESVTAATQQYVETQNHLPIFVAATFDRTPTGTVTLDEVWATYTSWSLRRGEEAVSRIKLTQYLKTVTGLKQTTSHKVARAWIGITLKTPSGERGDTGDNESKTPPRVGSKGGFTLAVPRVPLSPIPPGPLPPKDPRVTSEMLARVQANAARRAQ